MSETWPCLVIAVLLPVLGALYILACVVIARWLLRR